MGSSSKTQLRIIELFYSIQGESTRAGRPCVFVRLARCNLRCVWCDTVYSFKGGDLREIDELMEEIAAFGCELVEITGGEPLLQPPVHELMNRLCDAGYEVLLETSGSIDIAPVDARVTIVMDLKAPGSGEVDANLWANLGHLKPADELKIVIADRSDYEWAKKVCDEHDLWSYEVIFSPVHGVQDGHELAEWILADRLAVRLGLQLHKFLEVE